MAAREKKKSSQPDEKSGRECQPDVTTSTDKSKKKQFFIFSHSGIAAVIGLLLFALVAWVFLPALRGEFIEFDDSVYVTGNPHVISGLTHGNLAWACFNAVAGNWHPLTMWSLMLDHQLYGLKPWGYHLTNVLLHALNTVLVFVVLRRLTGVTWRSLLVAGLFGLHPLRVESVAWISERKDVLSGLFWLLALRAYARFAQQRSRVEGRESTDPAAGSRLWTLDYGLALTFFGLGLMSKPMVVTLPCVLLLLDYWPLRRFELSTLNSQLSTVLQLAFEKVPFFLLAGAVSVITYIVQQRGGMMRDLGDLPLGARCANALVSYGRYLGKLFWPADLCAHYLHPGHWPATTVMFAGGLVLGLSVLALAMRRRQPWWLVGWLWFLGTLVPMIGLVQVGTQSMADRYTYIPCLGVLVGLVWGAAELTRRWRHQAAGWGATGGVLALVCMGLTRHQIGYWKDGVSLWSHAVTVEQDNYAARDILGRALVAQGRIDEAIREFQESVKLKPDHARAEARFYLGDIFTQRSRVDEAIDQYQKAMEIQHPNLALAHNKLGVAFFQQGQLDEAILHHQKALEIEPLSAAHHSNLGRALFQKGQMDEALAHFQKAAELEPGAVASYDLGYALARMGQTDAAILHFQEALKSRPDYAEAHNNLGCALAQKGRVDEAIPHFQKAFESQSSLTEAHNNLGYALLEKGRVDDAITEFRKALSLKPNYPEASNNLVTALARKTSATELPAAKAKP